MFNVIIGTIIGFLLGWTMRTVKFKSDKDCANPAHTVGEKGESQEGT